MTTSAPWRATRDAAGAACASKLKDQSAVSRRHHPRQLAAGLYAIMSHLAGESSKSWPQFVTSGPLCAICSLWLQPGRQRSARPPIWRLARDLLLVRRVSSRLHQLGARSPMWLWLWAAEVDPTLVKNRARHCSPLREVELRMTPRSQSKVESVRSEFPNKQRRCSEQNLKLDGV